MFHMNADPEELAIMIPFFLLKYTDVKTHFESNTGDKIRDGLAP